MITRRGLVGISAACVLAPSLRARPALAQAWPTRFVRLVVPFTPGGGIDAVGRIVGARLAETWGQQVVVDNKPGAGGNIASEFVARSPPDGYTLYISAAGLAVNRYLFASVNYDPVADFAPVTLICLFPNVLVVPMSSPFRSVGDLLAAARNSPGKVTFASPGHGSSPHMSGELFKYLAKVELTHVPYRGASPAYTDVIAGRVDCTFAVMASGLPLVRSAQLRALGVTSAERVAAAPDLPTIAEAGVPGYEVTVWSGVIAPAGLPRPILDRLNTAVNAALETPEAKERIAQLGSEGGGGTPEQFADLIRRDSAKWAEVVKRSGAKID